MVQRTFELESEVYENGHLHFTVTTQTVGQYSQLIGLAMHQTGDNRLQIIAIQILVDFFGGYDRLVGLPVAHLVAVYRLLVRRSGHTTPGDSNRTRIDRIDLHVHRWSLRRSLVGST